MRVVLTTLASLAVGAYAFGVSNTQSRAASTQLFGMPDEMTAQIEENAKKAQRWREIRLLSDEEAQAQLSGEELESFTSYHAAVKEDITKMKQIAEMMQKDLNPPQVAPKSKKQRKRDKWAKRQALEAARAALLV